MDCRQGQNRKALVGRALADQKPHVCPHVCVLMQGLTKEDLSKLYFSAFKRFDVAGIPVWVTRTG